MGYVLIIAVVGTLNIVCFFVGAKVGQTVAKGEDIKLNIPNPVEAVRKHNDNKQADKNRDQLETLLRNIDKYDGTGRGQEDVPRG